MLICLCLEHLKEFRQMFEMILDGDKHVSQAKHNLVSFFNCFSRYLTVYLFTKFNELFIDWRGDLLHTKEYFTYIAAASIVMEGNRA